MFFNLSTLNVSNLKSLESLLALEATFKICAYPKINHTSDVKFWLITFASCIATAGIVCNLVLVLLFTRRQPKEPSFVFLALLDCVLCTTYVLLFGIEGWTYYFRIPSLYDILFSYTIPALLISRIVQFCIPFLLIYASIRTLSLLTNHGREFFSMLGQSMICGAILVLGIMIRLPTCWAYRIHHFASCSDRFRMKEVWPSAFGLTNWFVSYDSVLTVLLVFIPLVTLLSINGVVVYELRKTRSVYKENLNREMNGSFNENRPRTRQRHTYTTLLASYTVITEARESVTAERNAMHSMGIITATHIICNGIHSILTIYEKMGPALIASEDGWTIAYIWLCDMVSFLFMVCSAIRLAIHCRYNPTVRKELCLLFTRRKDGMMFHKESRISTKFIHEVTRDLVEEEDIIL